MGIIRQVTRSTTDNDGQPYEFIMQAPEVIETATAEVRCDGGALGHPRVYLRIGDEGWVECPYCDRRFVQSDGAERTESH